MTWTLFPKDRTEPSETARYTVTYTEFHPCVRPDRRKAHKTTVKGHAAYRATVEAIRASGGTVSRVDQRGR